MSTIYVIQPEASYKIHGSYFKVFHQDKQSFCIPIRNISQFIVFGNIKFPKEVLQMIRSYQIPALYSTQNGEPLGRLENSSVIRAKYLNYQKRRARDTEFNRATAESMLWAKFHNQHTFLQSSTQYYADEETQRGLNYLTLLMDNLPAASSIDDLLEYADEGDKIYNLAMASLLTLYHPCSRTAAKQINGLLTLGNNLLHQYIYTVLITAGLDPNYSILYREQHHELPLAWDFAAEFRAPIVDDLVFNFVRNLTKTNGNGKKHPNSILQRFLQSWEGKLRTFVLHPYAGEVTYRQCINLQVQEYVASLLGDVEYYRPLALKFHPSHRDFISLISPEKPALTLVK
jgi:CRISP-associated protein Cas1